MRYRVIDRLTDGAATSQDRGTYLLHELPTRLRQAVLARPEVTEWVIDEGGYETIVSACLWTRD